MAFSRTGAAHQILAGTLMLVSARGAQGATFEPRHHFTLVADGSDGAELRAAADVATITGAGPTSIEAPDAENVVNVLVRTVKDFETNYRHLGAWKGPHGSEAATVTRAKFWRDQGPQAATWLATKALGERHANRLNALSATFATIGPAAAPAMLDALSVADRDEVVECLLIAFDEIDLRQHPQLAERLLDTIRRFATNPSPDVRAAAIRATGALPKSQAAEVLAMMEADDDDTVQDAIVFARETR